VAITDPEIRIVLPPAPVKERAPGAVDVVWSLRDRAWYVRGLSHTDWRRLYGHHGENATDHDLVASAATMFTNERIPVHVRRLEPTHRLPKDAP
jgi:hypothetical protein